MTGIRDLDGFNEEVRPERLRALLRCARRFTGCECTPEQVSTWAGVMALSPDDLPIVGRVSAYRGLYVNTGHGFRGTNYALPSAVLLARAVLGGHGGHGVCDAAELELLGQSLAPSRFAL